MTETNLDLSGLAEKTLESGAVLMEQGATSGCVYVLKEGTVSVTVDGKQVHEENGSGTFFGEISVLLKQGHSATVTAKEPCTFCVIDDLLEFVKANPHVALDIAQVLADRVIRLHSALVEVRDQAAELQASVSDADKAGFSRLRAILETLDEITDRDIFHPLTPARTAQEEVKED